jgi:hypothetical protein
MQIPLKFQCVFQSAFQIPPVKLPPLATPADSVVEIPILRAVKIQPAPAEIPARMASVNPQFAAELGKVAAVAPPVPVLRQFVRIHSAWGVARSGNRVAHPISARWGLAPAVPAKPQGSKPSVCRAQCLRNALGTHVLLVALLRKATARKTAPVRPVVPETAVPRMSQPMQRNTASRIANGTEAKVIAGPAMFATEI